MTRFIDYSSDEEDFLTNGPRRDGRRPRTVLDILSNDRRFSRVFVGLTNNRQLRDDLTDSRGEFTIFAPTDEAFNKLKKETKKDLNEDELRDILQYLIIPEYIDADHIRKRNTLVKTSLELKSLNQHSQRLFLSEETEGKLFLNNKVQISEPDIKASNGVIHAIEEILLPPKNLNDQINQLSKPFSIALKAFKDTGLLDKINQEEGITVFLPTDGAFHNLGNEATEYLFSDEGKDDLKKILQYHVSKKLAYSTSIVGQEDSNHRGDNDKRNPERRRRGNDSDRERRRGDSDYDDDDNYGRGRRRGGDREDYPRRRDDYGRGGRHGGEHEGYPRRRNGRREDGDDYGRGGRHGSDREDYPRRRDGRSEGDDYGRGGRRGGDREEYPRRRNGHREDDEDYGRGRRRDGSENHPRGPDRDYDDRDDYDRGYPRRRGGWDEDYDGRNGRFEGHRPRRDNHRREGWNSNDEDWNTHRGQRERFLNTGNQNRRGNDDWEDDEDWDHHRRGSNDDWEDDEDWGKRPGGGRNERDHHETFENRVQLPTNLRNENLAIDVVGLKKRVDININHQVRILLTDGLASNGVFHAIDNVLIPKGVDLPKLSWYNINQESKV
ncbi:hypothetical protein K7432_012085 [Basidiobolus ranarum]|uniref:FAS1 domain-containing protein n=1 Tax=Basidiobolus ranarum TaxID=34480 RepID=A0ABR2VST1_9FUNG